MIEAKDIELSTDEIVKLFETLCQENTLKLVSRDGKNSYLFNKTVVDEAGNTNNKDSIDDDQDDSIDDDEDSTDDDKERNEQVGASNINPENFSLEQDIRSSMYFGILTDIIKSVSDLKNFLDFKINGLMAGQSNELLDFLREENRFLKQEIVETRKITNNILENITRQNISSGTPKSNTSITPSLITENNNWITTPNRRSVIKSSKTLDNINNDLISTNRFEALSIHTDFNNFIEQLQFICHDICWC